ncbi:MAG TPA: MFS transporter, partial [Pseudoduganella sp.]
MPHAAKPASRGRKPPFWVPTLYLAQGLPFYAIAVIAAQMFKSLGVANDDIGHWTAAIGMAWVLKPLWSPFLEL